MAGFLERGVKIAPIIAVVSFVLVFCGLFHYGENAGSGFAVELGIGCSIILFGGWTIHAVLFRVRPSENRLTQCYLIIALDGAFGGVLASLVFPLVSTTVVEYPIALSLLLVPVAFEIWRGWVACACRLGEPKWKLLKLDWKLDAAVVSAALIVGFGFGKHVKGSVLLTVRNFYGTGRVVLQHYDVVGGNDFDAHVFEHSGIQHGMQPVWVGLRDNGTLYYGPHAGGLAILKHPKYGKEPMRVAGVGMGIGTIATYACPGDTYRFYEINPQVVELAQNTNYFWYVSDCAGKVEVVVDDARRALEKERGAEKFDVIIVDVFSGDSIPPHMATREAFALYLERLAPNGIIAMHLTNWHLALSPVVKAAAKEFNLHLQALGCREINYSLSSYWALLTRWTADFYDKERHWEADLSDVADMPLMSDDKHSILPLISSDPMPRFRSRKVCE